jgi:ABC-type ATPase involved in cell division
MAIITYKPPTTIGEFIKDYRAGSLFHDWIVGPVGSGKTTGLFMKLVYMAKLQAPGADGVRRSRCVPS